MTEQEAYEQVRDNIAKYLNADGEGTPELRDKWWECALLNKARYRRVADEILSYSIKDKEIEEVVKAERERIREKMSSWIMGMGLGNEAGASYDWGQEWDKFWESLSENRLQALKSRFQEKK